MSIFDLETLLNLNGEVFPMENGFWTKFEAYRVEPTEQIPNGISYSLTLHDKNNRRVIGFDNAHAVKPKRKKYGARKMTWDHKHQQEKVSLRIGISRTTFRGFLGSCRSVSGRRSWLKMCLKSA